ncbi:MAG: response regulator [Chitinophagales bacterium]|nr:response regulator [Chitinophagales bacterium]
MISKLESIQAIVEQLQQMGLSEYKLKQLLPYLKAVEKDTIANDFKIRRVLMDKQIITNILNSAIADLEKKQVYIETANLELQMQKAEIEVQNRILAEQKSIIEEKSVYKDQFLANVSHELRTPLNGILGLSHLLEPLLATKQEKDYLRIIQNSTEHLSAIVNDLLDLSRLQVQQLRLNPQPFLPDKLLQNLEGIARLQSSGRNIELRVVKKGNLSKHLIGDPVRLYQIMVNLLNNAIKFTSEGYVELTSTVTEQTEGKFNWQLIVQDTGIGIEAEKIDSIFEDFKQVAPDQSRYGGAGLGLSIAKQLVDAMGGSISVQSQLTVGSCFTVDLGFDAASDDDIAEYQSYEQQKLISQQWQAKRVLIVEDNPVNRIYAQNLFAQWKLRSDEATTVAEAKEKSQQCHYDCIFVDIGLPDGRGLDFIKWLQDIPFEEAINTQTPIIILTAAVSEAYENVANTLNIKAYLTKPFVPNELFAQIAPLFNNTAIKVDEHTDAPQKSILPALPQPNRSEKYYLENLSQLLKGNKKYMAEILAIVVSQIPETISRLEVAIPAEDWESVRFETHRIKSTLNTLGIDSIRQPILRIEQLLRQKEYSTEITTLFEAFKTQCNAQMSRIQNSLLELTQAHATNN